MYLIAQSALSHVDPDLVRPIVKYVLESVGILLILLAKDVFRFSPRRMWAISSVNFRESIRRKVLWVTPLAMLGVIAVTQLSHPQDEQDAIRQTTKYCLFASGIVVVLTMLILACTNLPREIENRVIYTIVTKPATRLEIVLGKALGFARTSGLILLIMGVFSYGYLSFNARQLRTAAQIRLNNLPPTDTARETLSHYVREGLLHARTYEQPRLLQMFAEPPRNDVPYVWMSGTSEQNAIFPFSLPEKAFEAQNERAEVIFTIELATQQRPLTSREVEEYGDPNPALPMGRKMPVPPHVTVLLLNEDREQLVAPVELLDVGHLTKDSDPQNLPTGKTVKLETRIATKPGEPELKQAIIAVPSQILREKFAKVAPKDGQRRFYLQIVGTTLATQYGVPRNGGVSATLHLYDTAGKPLPPESLGTRNVQHVIIRGRMSTAHNQQLRGAADKKMAPVAIYNFRQDKADIGSAQQVAFEFRPRIERTGEAGESEDVTRVELTLVNAKTGFRSPVISVQPESDRPSFFYVSRDVVKDGAFDVLVRTRTEGHLLGLRESSLQLVSSTSSFAFNLFKSLLILWMLSVLVVIVAIFCSTFVSWPIAVVLTLVILLGRWAVVQIGESASPQAIFTDMFGAKGGAVEAKLFTETLKGLNTLLQTAAKVLPDTAQFRVTEDIERGISIPRGALIDAVKGLAIYGGAMLALGYLFFKRKEVAP